MEDLLIAIIALVVCYFTGSIREKNHYKKIKEREVALYKQPYISFCKKFKSQKPVKDAQLVASSVVIACDYFKVFVAGLRNFFGGNVSAYESILDRGRREAILRIREQAAKMGANIVVNVKVESVMLTPLGANQMPQLCMHAYGTAIKYDK